jgi:hypothetical protein
MKNNPENRYHIRGLDKLTARPLASYPTPETAKAALAMQASVHEQHRLDAVAQEIVLVCALAASKVISGHDMITVAKAWPQWGKGTKKDNTVAAHCLPGRILLNARPIDNLSEWLSEDSLDKCGIKALPMASTLRNLHGRTDVVDLIVNQVDSRLEIMTRGRGLKPLLAATVNRVVRPCRLEGNVNLPMIMEVGRQALDYYQLVGRFKYEELHEELSVDRRKARSESEATKLDKKLLVLEKFSDELNNTLVTPDALTPLGCANVLGQVTKGGAGVETAQIDAKTEKSVSTQTETPADQDSGDSNRESE